MAVDTQGGSTYEQAYVQQQQNSKGLKRFKSRILSPYQTYYEGEAVSVSAMNQTGPFDVLAGHINFFSLLTTGTVVLNTGFQRLEFPIARGIIRVHGGEVTLFADI